MSDIIDVEVIEFNNTKTNNTDTTMTSNDILAQYRNLKRKEWEAKPLWEQVLRLSAMWIIALLGCVLSFRVFSAVVTAGYAAGHQDAREGRNALEKGLRRAHDQMDRRNPPVPPVTPVQPSVNDIGIQ